MAGLVRWVWLGGFGLVGVVWSGWFDLAGLICQVWFGKFGLVEYDWTGVNKIAMIVRNSALVFMCFFLTFYV